MKNKKHAKKKKKRFPLVPAIVALMFFGGASIFLYPTVSNYFAEKNSSKKADEYSHQVMLLDEETAERELRKAIEYNEALAGDPVRDPFIEGSGMALPTNYLDVLNIGGTMCTIEIPKIHVKLPVLHGTSTEVLERAAGHIRQTAVPIGGVGNHPVITGHTGLSEAKLFTDLINLAEGDIFIIHVLRQTLYYEVYDVSVVLPEDISVLEPIENMDCVTLVTCTPYGVNSYRLLVRGIRAEKPAEEIIRELENAKRTLSEIIIEYSAVFIVILIIILITAGRVFFTVINRKKKTKSKNTRGI